MLKIRVIPILTFNGFALVKTKQFANPRMVGNAVQAARVYNSRGVDELVFTDIFASEQNRTLNLTLIKDIIKECLMPIGIGGAISSLEDINNLLKIGADKVIIKTKALVEPGFIEKAASVFGNQCITIAVDAKKQGNDYAIYNKLNIDISLEEFIKRCENLGAGELIVNSVDNDGMMNGFDIDLVKKVEKITSLPVVACGGGGKPQHYAQLFEETSIEAVASASIFHFTQYTPNDIKRTLESIGKPVRITT
jgi:cyclase